MIGKVRTYVLFSSSFRYEAAPNISHETIDGVRTLCGRLVSDAATVEPDSNNLDPDCIVCRRALDRTRPHCAHVCKHCGTERDPVKRSTCPSCGGYDWYAGRLIEPMPVPRSRPHENEKERAGRERAEEERFDYLKDEGLLRRR